MNSAARQILSDWNQQKIPYFSTPPAIHPSLIPSTSAYSVPPPPTILFIELTSLAVAATRNGEDGPVIAPGAENVGQAQILSTFSQPFTLEGLFGAVDAGVFGNRDGDDVPMGADDDGDVFWDAVEAPEAMEEDGSVFLLLSISYLP